MIEYLVTKIKGKTTCEQCKGTGMYLFQDTQIFCERCHGQEGCTALWQSLDALLSKRMSPLTASQEEKWHRIGNLL